ncbi:MAG: hypothetical protein U5N86_11115 [Planctomycetota bacterium]|nr:hypothetical protein [Planctomycetota bacterium]
MITTVLWAVTAFLLTLWPITLALSVASCISLVLQMFELPVRTKRRAGEIVRDIHSGRLTAEEAMEQL